MYQQTVDITHNGNALKVNMNYREASQDLLLFLHGIGCSKKSFSEAWSNPDIKNYSLLAIDFVGFGDTSGYDGFSYSMEEQAEVCEKVLKGFVDNHRLHIIAHSMGGAIGLLFSDDILNAAASFVSVEGNLIKEDCFLTRTSRDSLFDLFETKIFPNFTTKEIYLSDEELKDDQKELITIIRKYQRNFSLDQTSPHAFHKSSNSLVDYSDDGKLLETFKALTCKKAYFYGDKNATMPVLKELQQGDSIQKQSISNSGHFVMNDNPDEFYLRLLGFLPR